MATCCDSAGKKQGNCGFATSLGLLLIRLAMGAIFIYYGGQHLFGLFGGRGIHEFASTMFTSPPLAPPGTQGLVAGTTPHTFLFPPVTWAILSACTEFFGGIMLIIGMLSRLVSIPILIDMIVALWIYRAEGFGGYDFNIALIAMAAMVLLTGPGRCAVDARLFRRGLWSHGPQPLAASAETK